MACCPTPYVYINSDGTFINALGTVSTITNPNPQYFYDQCVQIVNGTIASIPDPAPTPVDCPCCPDNYIYSSIKGLCVSTLSQNYPPVHTVPCVVACVTPPTFECAPCGTSGIHNHFGFDFFSRQCSCTPLDPGPPCGGISAFLPAQFADPVLTFTLKNKNFI